MYTYTSKHPIFSAEEVKIINQLGTLSISYVELLDEETIEFTHRHINDYEFYYVYEGTMHFTVDEISYPMEEDEFFLVRPGVFHEVDYTPLQKHKYLAFIFNIDNTSAQTSNPFFWNQVKEQMGEKKFLRGNGGDACSQLIGFMMREFEVKSGGYKNMLLLYYQEFIQTACRQLFLKAPPEPQGHLPLNLPLLITKYMHEHYMIPELSLDDIARELCISKRHASRLFRDFFGRTLSKTLREYRMGYAIHYLVTTEQSNSWIADAVGLSLTTLSKLFVQRTGMTMSQYRRHFRKR